MILLPPELIEQYTMNAAEITFFSELIRQGDPFPGEFQLDRLPSHAFAVYYEGLPLGNINLWQKPYTMQYQVNQQEVRSVRKPDLKKCLQNIHQWLQYIRIVQAHLA